MQDDNQIPEEIDLTHAVNKSPAIPENSGVVDNPKQYGTGAIILGCAIILVIMAVIWLLVQPRSPSIPSNLPLPGSIPPKSVQPSLNQTK